MFGIKSQKYKQLEKRLLECQHDKKLVIEKVIYLTQQLFLKQQEVAELKKKSSPVSFLTTPTQIGPFDILEIKTAKTIDTDLIGVARLLVFFAGAAAVSKIFKKVVEVPELPETDTFLYRYYDRDKNEEHILPERQFKNLLKNRGVF